MVRWPCPFCGLIHRNPKAERRRRPRRVAAKIEARGGYRNYPPCRSQDHPGRMPALHVRSRGFDRQPEFLRDYLTLRGIASHMETRP